MLQRHCHLEMHIDEDFAMRTVVGALPLKRLNSVDRVPQGAAPIFVGDFNPGSLPTERALRNHFNHLGAVVRVYMVSATCKAIVWFKSQAQADAVVGCALPASRLLVQKMSACTGAITPDGATMSGQMKLRFWLYVLSPC